MDAPETLEPGTAHPPEDPPVGWWARLASSRRANLAALGVIAVLLAGFQQAPAARISPGPVTDLTAAVAAAQPGGAAPDGGGRLLATTILASPVSWFGAGWCTVAPGCQVLPVDTSDPDQREQAARAMTAAIENAQEAAHRFVPDALERRHVVLEADMGRVGGPSAGLMLSVVFVEALTGSDLTGGRVVAGTGTIDRAGQVGLIAGVEQKVRGAADAGATVFLAPTALAGAAEQAAAADGLTLQVVPVDTLDAAVAWLCGHGGTGPVCDLP